MFNLEAAEAGKLDNRQDVQVVVPVCKYYYYRYGSVFAAGATETTSSLLDRGIFQANS